MKISNVLSKLDAEAPEFVLNEEEFSENITKFGSLLTILKNKKINQTSLVSSLLDDLNIRNFFLLILESDDFNSQFRNLLNSYPNLARSKTIRIKYKKYLKTLNNEQIRTRNL